MNTYPAQRALAATPASAWIAAFALLACAGPALAVDSHPGALGDDFSAYLEELPDHAYTPAGRELLQRYRDNRERLAEVDLAERAVLPDDARECAVDETPYRRLLGLDYNPETILVRQIVNGSASNVAVGFEGFTVYAAETCPNEVDSGDVTFWVEYEQAMKRRPPEFETDIEAAREQYESWQGDTMPIQKRLDGRFEEGRPVGVFSVITHLFPMKEAARQIEEAGQDPSMMENHMYGYIMADGFDRSSMVLVSEMDSSAMSSLVLTLEQGRADRPGFLNTMLNFNESSHMDAPVISKSWMEHDPQGRLHGWVYRQTHEDDELRKACFQRNQPASPDECDPI